MNGEDSDTVNRRLSIDGPSRSSAGRDGADTVLVVGHDGDPSSDRALTVAVDLAVRLRAYLHVVHGIDLRDYPIDIDSADWEKQAAEQVEDQRRVVETRLVDAPCGWTYHAAHDDPARLLAALAREENALMIVVGSRGSGVAAAVARLLGGSVSTQVIRSQQHPVLVVPEHS